MDATTPPQTCWFHLTSDRFVLGLLAVEVLLWLSERFGWLGWHKGYAVLTGVAVVGVGMVVMLVWFVVALVFRWRFRFSLRSLLVLVVVVVLPYSWLAVEMKKTRDQTETVAEIVKLGGDYEYEYEFDYAYPDDVHHGQTMGGCFRLGVRRPAQAWLRKLLGEDFFANVVHVDLTYAERGGQDDLTLVRRLSLLQQLEIRDIDSGVDHLKELSQLRSLKCEGSFPDLVQGQSEELRELTRLEFLEVGGIYDNGLKRLEDFQRLKGLSIGTGNFTDAGLRSIGSLRNLKDLFLNTDRGRNVAVTDAGIKYLRELKHLEHLSLCDTGLTDAGLIHVRHLIQLRWLHLGGTGITDAGLENLRGLSHLEELLLDNTQVTDAGVAKLQQALPNCNITR